MSLKKKHQLLYFILFRNMHIYFYFGLVNKSFLKSCSTAF